jgi:hypothetical protein
MDTLSNTRKANQATSLFSTNPDMSNAPLTGKSSAIADRSGRLYILRKSLGRKLESCDGDR